MAVQFKLTHIGINSEDAEKAKKTADLLCLLFNLDIRETEKAYFADPYFECMKYMGAGRLGHISMECPDIHKAIKELESKGFECDVENGIKRADGSLRMCYIKYDFNGFAIHITEIDPSPIIYK